ncbi:Fic family protein [Telluribacter sp.]|jgi:Fic family protein|uniref:Fic family protein n=1 Tax=Telluribacter sp. TaxID=1978767 RepID=UPI002E0D46EA|nr:Fic family protein [Telluribacter sp.]
MQIQEIESLIQQFQYLSKGRVDFRKYAYYAITHHSTAIEGSTLTENQVIDLLEYGKTVPEKPFSHHLMAYDHYRALEYVVNQADSQRSQVNAHIAIDLLRDIAAHVMRGSGGPVNTVLGTYDTSKGDLRLSSVRAGNRSFPDAKKVPDLLKNFCESTNAQIHSAQTVEQKLRTSFQAHFDLVSIHPFGDGNGRTSRLLMNFIQTLFGLPISVVFVSDRFAYIEALEQARREEYMAPFYDFMFEQYGKFLVLEIRELKK